MRTRTVSAAVVLMCLLAGLGLAAPVHAEQLGPWPPGRTTSTEVLGRSVQGRTIDAVTVCSARPRTTVLLIGAIHGNEDAGVPVARRLARTVQPPPGVCLVVVASMDPDGMVHRYRQNARGVDLNRNFPGWIPIGRPWDPQHSGPSALSEPESRIMYRFINRIRPDAMVVYHQQMDLVDFCGGGRAVAHRYAALTGMRSTQLPRYRGSMATWAHNAYPAMTILTVELPARVPSAMVDRHVRAMQDLVARAR